MAGHPHCANPRCSNVLPLASRARTCSTRCRVALHRSNKPAGVPAALRDRPRWVRSSRSKAPLQADGSSASSTDPATWTTYAKVRAFTGKGFVLDGDGIVCVDLDHCISGDGSVAAWAQTILDACPPTYVEVSPSGTGLHIWGIGTVEYGRRIRRDDGAHIEVYGTGRYITVTGVPHTDSVSRLADVSGAVISVV